MESYRMYCLVLRQLSPMQKGIQAAHSIVEYSKRFGRRIEYETWSLIDKTIIVLDGGTYQEMKEDRNFLKQLGVVYDVFHEPDLNGMVTAYSLILSDKVWDTEKYPSYPDELVDSDESEPDWLVNMGGMKNLMLRNFIKSKRLSA